MAGYDLHDRILYFFQYTTGVLGYYGYGNVRPQASATYRPKN